MKKRSYKDNIFYRLLITAKGLAYAIFTLIAGFFLVMPFIEQVDYEYYLYVAIFFLVGPIIYFILIESIYQVILYIFWNEHFNNLFKRLTAPKSMNIVKKVFTFWVIVSILFFIFAFTYEEPKKEKFIPENYGATKIYNLPSPSPSPIETTEEMLLRCVTLEDFEIETTDNGLTYYKQYYIIFKGIIRNNCDEYIPTRTVDIKIVKSDDANGQKILDNSQNLTTFTGAWEPNETHQLRIEKQMPEEDLNKFYNLMWGSPINKLIPEK